MTHRQYLMWQLWLGQQWNEPDRHDHYSMRIAEELGKLRKDQSGTGGYYEPLSSFKVKFGSTTKEIVKQDTTSEDNVSQEEQPTSHAKDDRQIPPNINVHAMTVNAKARWAARRQIAKEQAAESKGKPK